MDKAIGKMPLCPFCEELEKGRLEINGNDFGNRVIFETKNFAVIPTLGQIIEGQVLIITKKHYLSMGQIPTGMIGELEGIYEKTRKALESEYGSAIFYEHGATSACARAGACIEHAHMQAAPAKVDIFSELAEKFQLREIDSISELRKEFKEKKAGIFYENRASKKFVFYVPEVIPSQYVRKIIAHKAGLDYKWDWKRHFGLTEMKSTINRLKPFFTINPALKQ